MAFGLHAKAGTLCFPGSLDIPFNNNVVCEHGAKKSLSLPKGSVVEETYFASTFITKSLMGIMLHCAMAMKKEGDKMSLSSFLLISTPLLW